jgi:putative flippase GtrA
MKNKRQLLRFGVVGGINTALDFGLLFVFKAFGLPIGFANILSTGIAFVFSFFANKKYTFKTSGTNVVREMILFVIVTLFGLWVLQTAVIQLTLPWLTGFIKQQELALLVAKLLATVVSLTWNYLLYSRIVFKKH